MDGVADTSAKRAPTPGRTLLQQLLDDHLLVCAFVVCILLFGYQLSATLLQPPWIKPGTDWLRSALAWPQMLVVAWVTLRLLRIGRPGAVTWCLAALGLLSYAVARTLWTIDDALVYAHGVPFPSLPDLFFILQYPFFFAALFLAPADGRWLPRFRVLLDGVLWMSAITALSWYFVLLPLARQTDTPSLSKDISMFYQAGDLVLLYALVVPLGRPCHTRKQLLVNALMSLAIASLFVADTWAGVLLLHPPHTYRTGGAPDLFWYLCYLLLPLAALVRLRLTPTELPFPPPASTEPLTRRDMLAGITFVLPSLVALGASVVIIVHATVASQSKGDLILPELVSIALLLLATLRPAVMYLEQEQLRRERDAARAQERALRIANAHMEAFLSMVAHELRTPLTSLTGNAQLMGRRLETLLRLLGNRDEDPDATNAASAANALRSLIAWSDQGLGRMRRLVEDVLDETRVRQGRLAVRLEPCDLAIVVGQAVAEQQALNPERTIRLIAEASSVPVRADASRIEQVVTNLVSNALKFSREDQPVEVRVQTKDGEARVSVHDDGVGIPLADQPHLWERFYQASGVDVQSGSQVGVGIGLYISKAIIEGHHGQIGVESAPGQGSTFWFTLPLASSEVVPTNATSPDAGAGSPVAPSGPVSTSDGARHHTSDPGEHP